MGKKVQNQLNLQINFSDETVLSNISAYRREKSKKIDGGGCCLEV